MSQEKVLKTLESLGFTKLEAQVYIFLGRKGPQKGISIIKALKIPKQQIYLILKNLQSKGIVNASIEHPAEFSALPFEKALDIFVKEKIEEAQQIECGKEEILLDWKSISLDETVDQTPRFAVIEGRKYIYPRLKQMIEDTKNQLLIISTVSGLIRANQFGVLETAFKHSAENNTKFRFLTELSEDNLDAMKFLLTKIPKGSIFEARAPDLGVKLISRMLISDDSEAVFFVSKEGDRTLLDVDDLCLWTNSKTIVESFKSVFDELWDNSTEVEKRIVEIETGKPTLKTLVIKDPLVAKKKFCDAVDAAKEEIVILTSAEGLSEVWKNFANLKEKANNGLDVRVMAPITRDNLGNTLKLSEFCKVRHVTSNHLGTVIIDGKHLFQFKNPKENTESASLISEDTILTDDSEYVEKTRYMLNEFWDRAPTPSPLTVENIIKPQSHQIAPVPDEEYTVSKKDGPHQKTIIDVEEKPGEITEEYVLNKIINAKKTSVIDPSRDVARFYGSSASAVIHPPIGFNLPDMFLNFYHNNKQSSYGVEDWFQVYLWLETPKGKLYVPVAIASDNPAALEQHKLTFASTPASKNCHLLRNDELQIQVHGNTLFAGWTVPISLFPPQFILPPASVLVEGYGKLKSSIIRITTPAGVKVVTEGNGFDAFVTFFHPASKYVGPGTDGIFARDFINTVTPSKLK